MMSYKISSTVILFIFVHSLPFVSSNKISSLRRRNQGTLNSDSTTTLRCAVTLVDTEYEYPAGRDLGDDDDEILCQPVVDRKMSALAYPLNLPQDFFELHKEKLFAGNRDVLIHGGYIEENVVKGITNDNVQLVRAARAVADLSGYVERSVLVVRVGALDSSPVYEAQEMSDNFFSEDRLTLRSQYSACSHGKLTFVPASRQLAGGIENGVLDIHLNLQAKDYSRLELTNEAIIETERILKTSITQVVNHVIICHPPNLRDADNWLAFAYLNQPISVYNGEWCGYVSANMHEVGHNLGFRHSNQIGSYADRTGYMGYSYNVTGWPSMCFNAVKNWQAGWFMDRAIDLDVTQGGWKGKIATFVDYHLVKADEYVLVKVGDLFLQYNRAKGMNAETFDKPNQIVIVESNTGESELIGGLDGEDFYTTYFQRQNFTGTGETLFVAICSHHFGDNKTQADYFRVFIGLDSLDCSERSGTSNEIIPVPATVSMSPTVSSQPSPSPSWIPPERGQSCDDDLSAIIVTDAGNFTCNTLSINTPLRQNVCIEGHKAYNVCAETCGKCVDGCADDDRYFLYEQQWRNCGWVRDQPYLDLNAICALGNTPHNYCRETCNSCDSFIDGNSCGDSIEDDAFSISLGISSQSHSCAWLSHSKNWFWRFALCNEKYETFHACAKTCSKCFIRSSCEDDVDSSFLLNGVQRDCSWLENEFIWTIRDACIQPNIAEKCRKTCGGCV